MLRDLTGEERVAYFRGILPLWGGGLSEERFQSFQDRLADAPEAKGRYRLLGWFPDGTMVSAMKAYELRAECGGRSIAVLGIGAVFTPPELRRRGHAAAMLRTALREYAARGVHAAVLFSDIGVRYYERLGFRAVESREATIGVQDLPRGGGSTRPAVTGDEPLMTRLFAASRGDRTTFALDRDGWTLRFQLRRLRELARARRVNEPDWGIVAEGRFGEAAAMLRFGRDAIDVLEAGWSTEAARDRLLGGLRECAHRVGRTQLRLWPAGQLRGMFDAEERHTALAMVAPLDGEISLPARGGRADLSLLDHI